MDSPTPSERAALEALYAQAEARAAAVAASRAAWPCRRGCDHCCRHLADALPLTEPEWRYLWEGFQKLPAAQQAEVRARVAQLSPEHAARPYTCPLLDPSTGSCTVYAHRPLVCRTYGFSVSRGSGNWCHLIAELLEHEGEEGLVWANHDVLERGVHGLGGEPLTFFEWFARHPPEAP